MMPRFSHPHVDQFARDAIEDLGLVHGLGSASTDPDLARAGFRAPMPTTRKVLRIV